MPDHRVGVVVPTRNRPERLAECLAGLAAAREHGEFPVWVCDASDDDALEAVREICAALPWVTLARHDGTSIPQARNACVRAADAELLVSVDDDVQVFPRAVAALVEAYDSGVGPRVVGGAVRWPDGWVTEPMVLRPIGYARPARPGEAPELLNSSLFLYPRSFGLTWPWNESMRRASDVMMSAMWRAAGVKLLWASEAQARHHPEVRGQVASDHDDHLLAILAHALLADRAPLKALQFETLGFASGLKAFAGRPRDAALFVAAWVRGNRAWLRDRARLAELAGRPAPPVPAR